MIEASRSEFRAKKKKPKGALGRPRGPGKHANANIVF
jgi:hypothetical protein